MELYWILKRVSPQARKWVCGQFPFTGDGTRADTPAKHLRQDSALRRERLKKLIV